MAAKTVLNYLERDSVIHKMTGTTKLAFFLLFTFASMITYNTWVLLGLFAVSLAAFRLSHIKYREVRFMMIFMLVFLVLNNLFIFLFDPNQGTTLYGTRHVLFHLFWRYDVTAEQLFYMLNISLKYFVALPVAILFISATNPSVHRARVITEQIVELYKQEELDEVYVIYTKMLNSIKEEVEVKQLLPLKTHTFIKQEMLEAAKKKKGNVDETDSDFFIYPSPSKVLKKLVYNYVTGFIYGALVEASASEENARMMAMQSATNNADEMLKELSIEYNRVRQAAITQEITEVIGGAKALKKKKKKQVR